MHPPAGPGYRSAGSNLSPYYTAKGSAELGSLAQNLLQIEPIPPIHATLAGQVPAVAGESPPDSPNSVAIRKAVSVGESKQVTQILAKHHCQPPAHLRRFSAAQNFFLRPAWLMNCPGFHLAPIAAQ